MQSQITGKMKKRIAGLIIIIMGISAVFGAPRLLAALRRVLEADRLTKSAALGYIPLERFVCTIPLGAAFRRRTEAPS